jgi:hypothetical protein
MRAKLRLGWLLLFLAAGYALGFVGLADLLPQENPYSVGVLVVWMVGYPYALVVYAEEADRREWSRPGSEDS